MSRLDWPTILERAQGVLVAHLGNKDETDYLVMAERGLAASPEQAVLPTTPVAPAGIPQPTYFVSGRL